WAGALKGAQATAANLSPPASRPRPRSQCSRVHSAAVTAWYSPTATMSGAIGKHKQPYRITLKTGEPFAMAGIYAREPTGFETAEKNPVNFAILTTKANNAVSYIHDRMPVILKPGTEKHWLTSNFTPPYVIPEFPAELLTSYPITPKMNRGSFNEPEAIQP